MRTCRYCTLAVSLKATGRPAKFCGSVHRHAAGRWRRRYAAVVRRVVLLMKGKAGAPQDGDPLIAEIIADVSREAA